MFRKCYIATQTGLPAHSNAQREKFKVYIKYKSIYIYKSRQYKLLPH